jgi:hypothetical protein
MDAQRFDRITRFIAHHTTQLRAVAHQTTPTTCIFQLHAETATGTDQDRVYDGRLTLEIGADGAIQGGSLQLEGGETLDVHGQANGRAVRFRASSAGDQSLSFSGVGQQAVASCAGEIAGIFSGPEVRDLGTWVTGDNVSTAPVDTPSTGAGAPTPTPCPPVACELGFEFDSTTCTCTCPRSVCNGFCCPDALGCEPETGNCRCAGEGIEFCGGECIPQCPQGQTRGADCSCVDLCVPGSLYCGGYCIDPMMDVDNCGSCGNFCESPTMCLGGVCAVCPSGFGCAGICCTFHEDPSTILEYICVSGGCLCTYACSAYCQSPGADTFTIGCDLDPSANCFGNCPLIVGGE